ncbi:secretin N-terminal domain-containing protein [Uliginosibacterium sp. H3]|uniref:Secretin N-terminal domain-containing protein n=1 Tax=Uliginosibacterium silvisoli TaxID=3114758 RepID=A0ABU6K4R8_9RHOO|nr:secretin N-terminal domain-containing protein [Uliginosibacterium sp. H3]
MRTTKKTLRLTAASGLVMALVTAITISGCASPSARNDLEYGKALMATGSLKDANTVLEKAQKEHPKDEEITAAVTASRQQLGNYLLSEGNTALGQGRWDAAAASFTQLAQVKGFEAQGTERAAVVAMSRRETGTPATASSSVSSAAVSSMASAPVAAASSASSSSAPVQVASSSAASSMSAVSSAAPVAAAPVQPAPVAQASSSARPAAVVQPVPKLVSPLDEAMAKKVTLQFRDAPVRSLFDAIGKTSGLNIVIDKDVQPDLRTSIYLKDTTIRNALEKIVLTTRLGWRATDDNTLLVYPDEPAKQADYQGLQVRGFHLANADAKIVANSLKTVLKFRDVVVDEKLNMIVVRDTPQAMAMAEQLIGLHDVAEPEVMLEVAIVEVTKGKLQALGVAWPASVTLVPISRASTSSTTVTSGVAVTNSAPGSPTLADLLGLSTNNLGMTIGGITFSANDTDSGVNVLANPRIRAKNKEKAKIQIGERVPNVSSNATSNGVISQAVTYIDVGLKLEVEPQVFPGNEIGLKIALEVSNINSTIENKTAGTVNYRIGTRNASTVLRLKDGENQILAGLIQDSDRQTVTKVPLLGDIPLLGRLFRSDSTDKSKTELILSITPRLIRGVAKPTAEAETFDAGTITSVRGRRNEAEAPQQIEQPQAPVQQQAPSNPDGQNGTQRRSRDD